MWHSSYYIKFNRSIQDKFYLTCKLTVIQLRIEAVLLQQLVVFALFDDMAALHDEDDIRLADGRQAMRDDEARAPPHHGGERLLDLQLGARVDGAGRLVQNQHRRQRQHEPRDAEQLPLPGGESCARVGQGRIIALRQARDEAVGMGGLRRGLDLGLRGLRPCQRDVLAHRAGLEPGVLQDHTEVLPEAVARDAAHIVPVDGSEIGKAEAVKQICAQNASAEAFF